MEKLCKIRDIQRSVNQFEARFENLYGICLNEGMLLCSLSTTDRLSSGGISDLLSLSPSNTSKVIKSVESKGLIERGIGANDKRQMFFSLTDKGKKLLSIISCDEIEVSLALNALI